MLKKFLFVIFIFTFLIVIFIFNFLFFKFKAPAFVSPFVAPPQLTINDKQPTITLIAVGDIMLGRNVNKKMHEYNDFLYPFRKVADFTSKADITFGNLESPFFDQCPVIGSGTFKFCGDYRSAEGLKIAGFDVLSLENNHIGNYGKNGLTQTMNLLTENDIAYSTFDNLTTKQFNNLTLGFLSFNLTFGLSKEKVVETVKENINKVDVLVVSLHWGEEYKTKPAKWQVDLAHQLIDLGVRVILGHHSHWIGEIEKYNNGLIFYSLGNFVFDQMWSQETRKGLVVKIIFEGKETKDYQTFQVLISDYSQPNFLITP